MLIARFYPILRLMGGKACNVLSVLSHLPCLLKRRERPHGKEEALRVGSQGAERLKPLQNLKNGVAT